MSWGEKQTHDIRRHSNHARSCHSTSAKSNRPGNRSVLEDDLRRRHGGEQQRALNPISGEREKRGVQFRERNRRQHHGQTWLLCERHVFRRLRAAITPRETEFGFRWRRGDSLRL